MDLTLRTLVESILVKIDAIERRLATIQDQQAEILVAVAEKNPRRITGREKRNQKKKKINTPSTS
jgi:hypothetical protein